MVVPLVKGGYVQITVVVVICHTIGAFVPESVDTLPDPVCREVIVIKDEMPMQSCMLSQPALADWKERSIYRGDQSAGSNASDYMPKEHAWLRLPQIANA